MDMRVNPLLQVGMLNRQRQEVGLQLYFCAVEEGGMYLPFLVKVPPRRHCTHQASRTSLLIVPGWTSCGMKGRERGGGPVLGGATGGRVLRHSGWSLCRGPGRTGKGTLLLGGRLFAQTCHRAWEGTTSFGILYHSNDIY